MKELDDIKCQFDENYINNFIMTNFNDYCDDEEMEEAGYVDSIKYYKETGAGGNGLEGDLINEIWKYLEEKGIDLSKDEHEDLKYDIEYYIKEFFPHYYFVDYRIETPIQKIMKSLGDKW